MKCKICDSNRCNFAFNAKGFDLFKCENCNFVFVEPLPSDEVIAEIYKSEYFDKGKYIDDFATRMEYKRRVEIVENAISGKNKILDFGCASGDFVNHLGKIFKIYGVDISNDAIALARKKYPESASKFFFFKDFEHSDCKFDVIVLWDVIEHVKNPVETLKDLKNYLTESGVLILSTPNINALTAKLFGSKWAFMTPPEHLCFFDKRSIEELAYKLDGKVFYWDTKGKWVNIAFLFYKIKRVFPSLVPQYFIDFLRKYFSRISLYIPTGDIQYVGIKFIKSKG